MKITSSVQGGKGAHFERYMLEGRRNALLMFATVTRLFLREKARH